MTPFFEINKYYNLYILKIYFSENNAIIQVNKKVGCKFKSGAGPLKSQNQYLVPPVPADN